MDLDVKCCGAAPQEFNAGRPEKLERHWKNSFCFLWTQIARSYFPVLREAFQLFQFP